MKTNKYTSVHKTGAELFWQSSKTVLTINAHRKETLILASPIKGILLK